MIWTLFILAAALGGTNPAFVKHLLAEFSPIVINFWRFGLASLVLLPILLFKKPSFKKDKKFLLAVNVCFALNVLLFAIGIKYTSIIMANILYMPNVLIVGFLGAIFLREKLTKLQIVGLILSTIGMVFLLEGSFKTGDVHSFGTPFGNSVVALATIFWALYLIFSRKAKDSYDTLTITTTNLIFTFTLCVFLIPFEKLLSLSSSTPPTVDNSDVIIFGYIAIVSTVGFFFVFQLLLAKVTAFASSFVNYLATVFSILTGILFFNETLAPTLIVGELLIIAGVFFATSFNYARSKISK